MVLAVKNAHQVKAETIKAVELNPLLDRLLDVVANHGSLAGYIVPTEGSVGSLAILVIAINNTLGQSAQKQIHQRGKHGYRQRP